MLLHTFQCINEYRYALTDTSKYAFLFYLFWSTAEYNKNKEIDQNVPET